MYADQSPERAIEIVGIAAELRGQLGSTSTERVVMLDPRALVGRQLHTH